MQNDNNAFEALLDLLDEGGDLDGLTDSESIEDGKTVLADLYGSPGAALAEMKRLAPGLSDAQYENISAISATSVLAVLAKSYAAPATLASSTGEAPQGGGISGDNLRGDHQGLVAGRPKPTRASAAQAAKLHKLFRYAAAQDHTP